MAGNSHSGRRGVDLAVHQRIRRLAGLGLSYSMIAQLVGIEVTAARRLARLPLPQKWKRCECGAMADRRPCLACTLSAARVNEDSIELPGTR